MHSDTMTLAHAGTPMAARRATIIPPGCLRLLLATIVVIDHFSSIGLGTTAVNLFFALSGFWVYRMFEGKYTGARFPGLLFVASRLFRLLPAFLLFNIIAIVVQAGLLGKSTHDFSLAGILPNIFILGYASLDFRPLGPAWSLDIEMQFYLLFPFVIRFLRTSKAVSGAVVLAALALGGLYISVFLHDSARLVLPYSGFFLLGIFTARHAWKPSAWLVRASLLISVASLAVFLALPDLRGVLVHHVSAEASVWNAAANFGLAVLLTPFALSTVYVKSTPPDRLAGDLSYIVYCSHWPAVVIAGHYLAGTGVAIKAPAVAALIAVIYLVSIVVLLYFDQPISQWRERWITRRLRPA